VPSNRASIAASCSPAKTLTSSTEIAPLPGNKYKTCSNHRMTLD
jgi:hypothetical protein